MTGHGEKRSRKQEEAIAALLSHSSIPEAARAINLGEKTLWRWLQDDDFRKAYMEARAEVVRHAVVQVQTCMNEAVGTLREVMSDPQAPASSRVSAAKSMLDLGVKAVEVEDLSSRLKRLEEKLNL